eukprot:3419027-Alexandrium_andersonii.AAC.1
MQAHPGRVWSIGAVVASSGSGMIRLHPWPFSTEARRASLLHSSVIAANCGRTAAANSGRQRRWA